MPFRIAEIQDMKERGEIIPCVTSYDYPTARLADEAGIPLILVGDSVGNVVLGFESTVRVTMDQMLHHLKAVVRGVERALVVADMPFMSYQITVEEAVGNAGRMLQEGGAQAVKLEGGRRVERTINRLVEIGVPVMGHLGLTPQSVNQFSGYKVQGRTPETAKELLADALAIEAAGAFSIVLEMVPAPLAEVITSHLKIPTIGIGAGVGCDGQIQVLHDILGFTTGFVPKHTKQYAHLADVITEALHAYAKEVRAKSFPMPEHGHPLGDEVIKAVLASIDGHQ